MKFITVKKSALIFKAKIKAPMTPFSSPKMCPVCGHYRGNESFCPNCGSSFSVKAIKQVKAHVRAGKPVVSYAQRKRDGDALPVFGRPWEQIKQMQRGTYKPEPLQREPGKDYGADPLGDGKFRMVPSGDVVDFDERQRRLRKAEFDGYLAVSPRMSASERYVNRDRLRQLNETEDERRKEADEAAKQSMRNRQPQAAWSEQNKMSEQEKVQYEGKHLDAGRNTKR